MDIHKSYVSAESCWETPYKLLFVRVSQYLRDSIKYNTLWLILKGSTSDQIRVSFSMRAKNQ